MSIGKTFQSARPPFLILAPVCVLLGVGTASYSGHPVATLDLVLVFIGALMAHISVNTFNEYYDFKSGLDHKTTRTPFSGGSGGLVTAPENANHVLVLAWLSLLITALIGCYFLFTAGIGLLPLGLLGLLTIWAYTEWITRSPLLCLIAPGLGFGFLMVAGTHYALTGTYSTLAWVTAAVPFFLANNLLLLNQFPDIDADKEVGRFHFPIAFGTRTSSVIYGVFVAATLITIVAAVMLDVLPGLALIALLPLPLAFISMKAAMRLSHYIAQQPKFLAMNVSVSLMTPALLGASLLVS